MITKIYPCERSIDVFHNGILTRSQRIISRIIYSTKNNGVKYRGNNLCIDDGNRIHRICITMRTNVILRSDSNNKLIIGDTIYRK